MTEAPDDGDEYPQVSSERLGSRGWRIEIRRAPYRKAEFRLEDDEVNPVAEHLQNLPVEGDEQ